MFQSALRIGKLNLLIKSKGSPSLFFTWWPNILVVFQFHQYNFCHLLDEHCHLLIDQILHASFAKSKVSVYKINNHKPATFQSRIKISSKQVKTQEQPTWASWERTSSALAKPSPRWWSLLRPPGWALWAGHETLKRSFPKKENGQINIGDKRVRATWSSGSSLSIFKTDANLGSNRPK